MCGNRGEGLKRTRGFQKVNLCRLTVLGLQFKKFWFVLYVKGGEITDLIRQVKYYSRKVKEKSKMKDNWEGMEVSNVIENFY